MTEPKVDLISADLAALELRVLTPRSERAMVETIDGYAHLNELALLEGDRIIIIDSLSLLGDADDAGAVSLRELREAVCEVPAYPDEPVHDAKNNKFKFENAHINSHKRGRRK